MHGATVRMVSKIKIQTAICQETNQVDPYAWQVGMLADAAWPAVILNDLSDV